MGAGQGAKEMRPKRPPGGLSPRDARLLPLPPSRSTLDPLDNAKKHCQARIASAGARPFLG